MHSFLFGQLREFFGCSIDICFKHIIHVSIESRDALLTIFDVVEHVLFDTSNDSNRIEEVVRTLYRLSPTEARLASMLVYNPYLADVSATLGISYHTARTHLKHIYQKTDTKKLPALIQKIISGPAGLLIKSTN